MLKLLRSFIEQKHVLVLGFGREGKSTLRRLLEAGGAASITVAENELQALLSLLAMLLLFVPALVLLAVYWFCRRRRKCREDVEKMKIQDL